MIHMRIFELLDDDKNEIRRKKFKQVLNETSINEYNLINNLISKIKENIKNIK